MSDTFKYTPGFEEKFRNEGRLSLKQRLFYENNGFLVIPHLIEKSLLLKCEERFLDIVHEREQRGGITLMRDITLKNIVGSEDQTQERVVNKIQDILWDPVFMEYSMNSKLLDVVENFVGPNITAVHSMLINKPPDPGTLTSRHPWHQDLYYFPFRPANRIVAAWTAMEKIDNHNGCLKVIPGSHKKEELLPHAYPEWKDGVNKLYHAAKDVNESELIELHMEAGDTVFFHPLLVHGSGPNLSKRFRRAISVHYASSECHYIDVKGTMQESLETEVAKLISRKGYQNFSYRDLWHFRSRSVRGREGKL